MFSQGQVESLIRATPSSLTPALQLESWVSLIYTFRPQKYLEIGAFEGRSLSLFCAIASSVVDAEILVTSIDSWRGGSEHERSGHDMRFAESCYDSVVDICKSVLGARLKCEKLKDLSRLALHRIYEREGFYDMIFVDGGHKSKEVLSDLVLSWDLLGNGGVMVIDDYIWMGSPDIVLDSPKMGVDSFLTCFAGEYTIIANLPLNQIYLLKEDAKSVIIEKSVNATAIPKFDVPRSLSFFAPKPS